MPNNKTPCVINLGAERFEQATIIFKLDLIYIAEPGFPR